MSCSLLLSFLLEPATRLCVSPVMWLSSGGEDGKGEEHGDEVTLFTPLLVFCHGALSNQSEDKTLKISQFCGNRRTEPTGFSSCARGAPPAYDSFSRPMNFSVFMCASRKSVCLLKSFIYIHRHFLDALNWFQARSWVMSISPATVHKHTAHSRTILEARCSTARRRADTQQPFCGNVLKVCLRVWVVCILHVNPLL